MLLHQHEDEQRQKGKINVQIYGTGVKTFPKKIWLNLDLEGFVPLEDILKALQKRFPKQITLISSIWLIHLLNQALKSKGIKYNRCAHSLKVDLDWEPSIPGEFLYHGTSPLLEGKIKKERLKPMTRVYVHLSKTVDQAIKVGKRKPKRSLVFKIFAKKAHQRGIRFFDRGSVVVVRYVPPEVLPCIGI